MKGNGYPYPLPGRAEGLPAAFLGDGTCSPLRDPAVTAQKRPTVRVGSSRPLRGFAEFAAVYECYYQDRTPVEHWSYDIPPDRLTEALAAGARKEGGRGQ